MPPRLSRAALGVAAVVVIAALAQPTAAPRSAEQPIRASAGLIAQCLGADPSLSARDVETGAYRFIGSEAGQPIPQPASLERGASAETAARAYLVSCGSLFGVNDQSRQLGTVAQAAKAALGGMQSASSALVDTATDDSDRSSVRFQQFHQGIPIIGAEVVVNLDRELNILSVAGETVADPGLAPRAAVSAATAAEAAFAVTARTHNVSRNVLQATTPALWLYEPSLIGPTDGTTRLVWRVEVTPRAVLLPIREFVLVDALTGSVPLHFNQVHAAMQRQTYSANNTAALPGTLVCDESNPGCAGGDAHAVAAHASAADTYAFYLNTHGRDSINNAGMAMRQTVHYGVNYANAFWNGSQMVYGDGYGFALADDVVGHELTHGVTQYESNLLYYYQSGAINESFSDLWGEFVDQTNGRGNDSAAAKWLVGEDITGIGAIRSMNNPPAFADPDRMTSSFYHTGTGDSGGVHTNSGVNNKAVSLMVDGGTFNGQTIGALGITKVAKIYYEAQANLLTSGSDYLDLHNALFQACTTLTGTSGITGADCSEVRKATLAVEMHLQPVADFNPDAPICTGGLAPSHAFFDNMESGSGNFVAAAGIGTNRWQYSPGQPFATSGLKFFKATDNPATVTDSWLAMGSSVTVPANAYLHFAQAFAFESGNFDGGVIEYSTDGGTTWADAGSLFDANGYRGVIVSGEGNPLAGRQAFVGHSRGYISSRLNLSSLAGRSVRFRWRMGLDAIIAREGWWVDDVRIYACGTPPPAAMPVAPNGIVSTLTPTYSWTPVADATWYRLTIESTYGVAIFNSWYQSAAVCAGGGAVCAAGPGSTPAPPSLANTAGYIWKIQTWSSGGYGPEASLPFTPTLIGPPAPTPIAPVSSVTTGTPSYSWNREAGAASSWYFLEVNSNPASGVSTNLFNGWYQSSAICTAVTCTVQPSAVGAPPALGNGPHKWRVKGWLVVPGAPSSYLPFVTNSPTAVPQAPILATPANVIGPITPAYTWERVPVATSYTLWINELPEGGSAGGNLLNRVYDAAVVCNATTCSVDAFTALPPPALTAGKPYRWWVRAHNAVGGGPWSSALNFRVGYPARGRVTSVSSSTALAGVDVEFYTTGGSLVARAVTEASGDYLAGLLPGVYVARTRNAQGYIDEISDNQPCGVSCELSVGTPITVTTAGVTGIDFALDLGGRVSGRVVSAPTTAPLADVLVELYNASRTFLTSGRTNAEGQFLSDAGLPTGTYFARTSNSASLVNEMFDNVVCLGDCDMTTGTAIAVTTGVTTQNIDFALVAGGHIAGRVTSAATATGLSDGRVAIYASVGGGSVRVSEGAVDALGNYTSVGGLPTGNYFARTEGFAFHIDEAYDNLMCLNCDPAGGTPIAVTAGTTTTNVNFALATGGALRGTITSSAGSTGLANVPVTIYNSTGDAISTVVTGSTGSYGPLHLPAGIYYAATTSAAGFVNKLYNNITCNTCSPLSGTPITIATGITRSGVDFVLASGSLLTGRVTDAGTGLGLNNVTVQLYTSTGAVASTVTTDASGHYTTTTRLVSGTYFARASNASGYGSLLYNNVSCVGPCSVITGTPIVIAAPTTRTNIDFALPALPGVVTLVSPTGPFPYSSTPTYTWNREATATWYSMVVGNASGAVFQRWYMASQICGATTCAASPATTGMGAPPASLGIGAYTWTIQTWSSSGYGPVSVAMSFAISPPGSSSGLSPVGVITATRPTYTWSAVDGATWYYLWINDPAGAIFKQWYQAHEVCVAAVCGVAPPRSLASGNFKWWVQTWSSVGYGPWSPETAFRVDGSGSSR